MRRGRSAAPSANSSYYLNTDLCLTSRTDLTPIARAWTRKTTLLHCGRHGRSWLASFEARGSGEPGRRTPAQDITRLLRVIGTLPGALAKLWAGCTSRQMHIGWQASSDRPEGAFEIEAPLLLALARQQVVLAVTIYPSSENDLGA